MPKGVLFEHGPIAHGERPGNLVRFFECRDVLVHGVTIQNSPTWTSHYRKCENVTIEAVRINSDASGKRIPNDDGIDLVECDDVRILGCDIDTGDDCIALFGSQRVVVTNCTMTTRSVAIRVGYDHTRDIRDCVFSNLVIHDANRGLGVFVRGSGSVENVIFSDIVIRTRLLTGHWWGKAEPVHVSAVLWAPGVEKPGRIRNVTFARLRVEGEHGMILWGSPDSVIEDVTLDDVRVRVRRGPNSDTWGGNVDMRLTRDPKLAALQAGPAGAPRPPHRAARGAEPDRRVGRRRAGVLHPRDRGGVVPRAGGGRLPRPAGPGDGIGDPAGRRRGRGRPRQPGGAGTDTFVEAQERTVALLFVQHFPYDEQKIFWRFSTLAYAAIVDWRDSTMRNRTLGRTGVSVSEIGFGAWAIGGSWGEQKEEDSIAALHRALDLGCNFIDTAAGYGDGRSERIIGKVLKERKETVFVATKTPPAPGPGRPPPTAGTTSATPRATSARTSRSASGTSAPSGSTSCSSTPGPAPGTATRGPSRSCGSCRPRGRSASSASRRRSTTRTASST